MAQHDIADQVELQKFAENFRFARKRMGLRQIDVSQKAKLTPEFVSLFERRVIGIGIDSMSTLSKSLEIPLYALLDPKFQSNFSFGSRLAIWVKYLKLLPESDHLTKERVVFGRNLKTFRTEKKYTQNQIGEITGIPSTQITLIERGLTGTEFYTLLKLSHSVEKRLFILFKP